MAARTSKQVRMAAYTRDGSPATRAAAPGARRAIAARRAIEARRALPRPLWGSLKPAGTRGPARVFRQR
eukprot:2308659-Prymnesium_polylepis.1